MVLNFVLIYSRWVRMAAFQALGPFISTFADPAITALLHNDNGEIVIADPELLALRLVSLHQLSLSLLQTLFVYCFFMFSSFLSLSLFLFFSLSLFLVNILFSFLLFSFCLFSFSLFSFLSLSLSVFLLDDKMQAVVNHLGSSSFKLS